MAIIKYINFVNKKPKNVNKIKFCLSYCVPCVLVICFLVYLSFLVLKKNLYNLDSYNSEKFTRVSLDLTQIPKIVLPDDNVLVEPKNRNCSYWDCFNVYRCGQKNSEKISIYVYPLKYYTDTKGTRAYTLSKEFYIILKTIINSPYYTSNPNEACILIPSIDLMNLFNVDEDLVSKALAVLPHWNNGENHVLINMVAPNLEEFATANALVASAKLDTWSYRRGFDISMPFYSPHVYKINYKNILKHESDDRPFLLIASSSTMTVPQINIFHDIAFNQQKILFFKACGKNEYQTEYSTQKHLTENGNYYCSYPAKDVYEYPNLLELGEFCLVTLDGNLNQMSLLEAMTSLCIPVIVNNIDMLPFAEIIDWKLAAITINEASLSSIYDILNGVTLDHRIDLRSHLKWLYEKYFNSLETIVHTMLDELNDRIQPHVAKNYLDWNLQPLPKSTKNPLFLPLIAPKSQGFTAVILTYDRVESLMTLVQKLAVVQSLQKIIIIWNNQKKSPPHLAMFQKISKPLKIIKTKENKLSNRFYPYEEIETEAILTIDDDIIMLTADELDFGYEVWREFPDRIVGFPSRIHVWDNTTNTWTYESEWTNQISMVLTGAAFHHKFWSYMYTNSMPGNIKEWVDEKMNCEDIAMNFLVANITNKPPIKVAPRKKFKCPECTNSEMLSADLNHMKERSACIDRFSKIYGNMPLKTVEFRADPVLYKDNFPEKLKRFNDIGSL